MIYSYQRVSSKDQNLQRQEEAFNKWCDEEKVTEYKVFSDKQSGKNFERLGYQELINTIKKDDIVVIKSIDRLGRNYDMIIEEWSRITKTIGADIVVLDLPLLDTRTKKENLTGKLIGNIVLELLSYVAQVERENIKQRQAEGIKIAKEKGVKFGRDKKFTPDQIASIKADYESGMKIVDVLNNNNISRTKLFAFVKEYGWKVRNNRGNF